MAKSVGPFCTVCEKEFRRGERYIAITRAHERVGVFGAVKVEEAELVAAYHPGCAPAEERGLNR